MGRVRWNAAARGWFGSNEMLSLFVDEQTYEQHLRAYLLTQGIEYRTHTEYVQSAEEA